MRRLFGPTVEFKLDRADLHAGEDLTGQILIGNHSQRERTYRNVELRLYELNGGRPREEGIWLLRSEVAVSAGEVLEIPFTVPIAPELKPRSVEAVVMLQPFGPSLAGPPRALVYIRPHREFTAVVFALAAVGNARLAKWLREPTNPQKTELFPRTAEPGALFVSLVCVEHISFGKEALGWFRVSRCCASEEGMEPEEVAELAFEVHLGEIISLKAQFREILAPIWNDTRDLPLPATPGPPDIRFPLPAEPPSDSVPRR